MNNQIVKFRPPLLGFDKQNINTFRCGLAALKRFKVGDTIDFENTKTGEIFAQAKVIAIHSGDKYDMADLYGADNHAIKGLGITDNISATLLKRVKNASGIRAFDHPMMVVIYFEIINEQIKIQELGD